MKTSIRSDDGFRIFCDDDKFAAAFPEIRKILRERRGKVLRDATDEKKRKRLVLKTEIAGTPVVVKQEFFIFRFDRSLKAFFFGSDAKNVFRVSDRARRTGFFGIPRMFLAAEKFVGGILRETISVTEFLDGESPHAPFPPEVRTQIAALMRECHANGITSGDVCADNFLMTLDGAKLIDFRGHKIFLEISKARDRRQLERVFGIPNTRRDFAEKIFCSQCALRNFGRKLRGKEPTLD